MTTWHDLIETALRERNETPADIIHCTLPDDALAVEFDSDHSKPMGKPFTLWTHEWVYFPAFGIYECRSEYHDVEWCEYDVFVASVPREPCDHATSHVGGE